MDKVKQVELVKQVLDEIPHLRGLHLNSGEFTLWKNKTSKMLESGYGLESIEYRRFVNSPGKSFAMGTEMGRQQEYNRQLDCYEEALKSLIN